jgi:WD40 repeat protein
LVDASEESLKGRIIVWDTLTGKATLCFNTGGQLRALAFDPLGTAIATADIPVNPEESGLKVWDAQTGYRKLGFRDETGRVASIAWNYDGRRLATAAPRRGDSVNIWEIASGRKALNLSAGRFVTALIWSPTGRRLAAPGLESSGYRIRIWEVSSKNDPLIVRGHPRMLIDSLEFTPDETHLVSVAIGYSSRASAKDSCAEVWKWNTTTGQGKCLLWTTDQDGPVSCVCLSRDATRLVTGHRDGSVKVWALGTGR